MVGLREVEPQRSYLVCADMLRAVLSQELTGHGTSAHMSPTLERESLFTVNDDFSYSFISREPVRN